MKNEIFKMVSEELNVPVQDEDENLFNLGMDSLMVLKFVTLLEMNNHVRIPDNDLTYENLHSVSALTHLVLRNE